MSANHIKVRFIVNKTGVLVLFVCLSVSGVEYFVVREYSLSSQEVRARCNRTEQVVSVSVSGWLVRVKCAAVFHCSE